MTRIRWPAALALLAALILLRVSVSSVPELDSTGASLAQAMAFLFPIGLTLIASTSLPSGHFDSTAGLATLALSIALIGYLTTGFGLHFGGAASVSDNDELQNLSRFFSLVRGDDGTHWGIFGLEGFFLAGDAATPTALRLFLSQLPLAASVALLVMLALPNGTPLLAQVSAGLIVSAVTWPISGHWVSGGGWLTHLGESMHLGHGLVDYAGVGTVFIIGAFTVLAAALVFGRRPASPAEKTADLAAPMPMARFPILAGIGALLTAVGWMSLSVSNPLSAEGIDELNWALMAVNGLAGMAGGTLTAQLYSWFTTGRFDPLMGPRGALAGLVAASTGAPFVPTWSALVTGGIAGLLLPLTIYVIEHLLRFDDATAAIASYGFSGVWGLSSTAIFADGLWGQAWNGIIWPSGQGVTGLIVASGLRSDSGQLAAQVWGAVALIVLGFMLPWGIFKLVSALHSLRLPLRRPVTEQPAAAINPSKTSGESQNTSGSFDRVVNVDDGG